jgi:chromosome segregation ATPase
MSNKNWAEKIAVAHQARETAQSMQAEIDAAGLGNPVKAKRDALRMTNDRLHVEIARLEGLVERRDVEIDRLTREWNASLDQIEQLRERNKTLEGRLDQILTLTAAHDFESHALQADLAQARAETDDLVAKAWDAAGAGFDELRAENERLTLADRQWAEHVTRLADVVARQRAEVERLQAALNDIAALRRSDAVAALAIAAEALSQR